MRTPDDGLAAVAYAPSRVTTTVRGVPVEINLQTDYPFRDALHLAIVAQEPVRFPLLLRIPGWAHDPVIQVNAGATVHPEAGTFYRVEREWRNTTKIILTLPMRPTLSHRPNQAVAIERGPLVYGLKIGKDWRRIHEEEPFRAHCFVS